MPRQLGHTQHLGPLPSCPLRLSTWATCVLRFMPNVSSTQISMLAAMPAPMGQAAAKAINGSVASSTGRIPRVRCMRTVFWYAVATGP